jgi:hypothetical protein
MAALQLEEMPVELFTAHSRITGKYPTRHIHIRDALNEAQESYLDLQAANIDYLEDAQRPSVSSIEARLDKRAIILAVPHRVRGHTEVIKRRAFLAQAGRWEDRLLISVPPFQISGNLKLPRGYNVKDALNRMEETFIALSEVAVRYLPLASVSFTVQEIVVNRDYIQMVCAGFHEDLEELGKLPHLPSG